MIAVLARDKREFDEWINPFVKRGDHRKFVYIASIDSVQGIRFVESICLNGWADKKDAYRLALAVDTRIMG